MARLNKIFVENCGSTLKTTLFLNQFTIQKNQVRVTGLKAWKE